MPDSVGNSFNTALGISLGPAPRLFADSIEFDDNDYYRFTLSSRSTLAVSLSGLVNNADVQVLSSAGTVVTDNDGFVLSSTNDGTLLEAFTALLDAGTYYIRVFPGSPLSTSTTATTPYRLSVAADDNVRSDILWRNGTTGATEIWRMNLNRRDRIDPIPAPSTSWLLSGTALNRDGAAEIVWRNRTSGLHSVWVMDGTTRVSSYGFASRTDLNWQIRGYADFDGDGNPDVLWQNQTTRTSEIWLMNRSTILSTVSLPSVASSFWQIQGVGDLNGDDDIDILWRYQGSDTNAGNSVVWLMNGTTRSASAALPRDTNLNKRFQGFGDFNGDGRNDLLLRNFSNGANEVWYMDSNTRLSVGTIPSQTNLTSFAIAPYLRIGAVQRLDLAGNTTTAAFSLGALTGNGTFRDALSTTDTDDYYRFSVGDSTTFSLSLTGLNGGQLTGDLDLRVYSEAGALVAESTGDGNSAEAIATTLAAGTYFIRVNAVLGSGSLYDLVIQSNSLPVLQSNLPLTVSEGDQRALSNTLLLVRDANDPPENVVYTLVSPPSSTVGSLSFGPTALVANSTFTQADINNGRLTYVHNGSETIADSFVFSVSDGRGGSITPTTYNINVVPVNDPVTLLANQPLTLSEGAAVEITNANLNATDIEQGPERLVYSLGTSVRSGTLLVGGRPITTGGTFTQADIDSNRLTYTNNGSETTSDSFVFTLTDGAGGSATVLPATFSLNITGVNDPPVLVSNRGLAISQGQSSTIGVTILNTSDAEFVTAAQRDRIIYTLTAQPANGSLFRAGTTGSLGSGATFTQADIDNGRILYSHDSSPTNSDTFRFTVSDGEATLPEAIFEISVTGVQFPPVLVSNTPLAATEGETTVFTTTQLQVTDRDTPEPLLVYTLGATPTNGEIRRLGVALTTGQTFSQQDISGGSVAYAHNGSETLRDSFSFTVSDGTTVLGSQTFAINVTPMNDVPVLVSKGGLTLNEGTSAALTNTLLLVTDADNPPVASLVYTIGDVPQTGSILLNGATLANGATFTQADINANRVRYAHSGDETIADNFTFTVSDGQGGEITPPQRLDIVITPVNDPPRLTSTPGLTLREGESVVLSPTELTVTDLDGPEPIAYTISSLPSRGTLTLNGNTLAAGQTFSQADIDNGRVTYIHNGSELPTDSFTFTASDGGPGGALSTTSLTINVTPVNDAPIITAPTTAIALSEDTNFTFTNANRISVSDPDGGTADFTVILSVNNGTLTLTANGTTVSGNNSNNVTVRGAASAVNSALSTLRYRGLQDFSGPDSLIVRVNDEGNTGDGGAQEATTTIDLNVAAVNDAPTLTLATSSISAFEDQTLGITGITVSDVDAGDTSIRATLRTSNGGILTFTNAAGVEFVEGSADGSTAVTLAGTVDAIRNALGSLVYLGAQDYSGSDSIAITINDQGATGSPGPLTASRTLAVNVQAVNDRPTFTGGVSQVLNEDAAAQRITNWATTILAGPANESGQTRTFGTTNDNTALFSAQPTVDSAGTLTYTFARNAFGTANVTVTLRDNGGTANGGVDTSEPYVFTIVANSVNDAPTFRIGSTQTTTEDAGPVTVANFITQISPGPSTPASPGPGGTNEAGQQVEFLIETSNPSLFAEAGQPTIASNGTLTYTPAADANGSATVTVRLRDDGGTENGGVDTSPAQIFVINVTAANDAPVISLPPTTQTMDEDSVLAISEISFTDVDAGTGDVRVILTSSNGNLRLGSTTGISVTGNNTRNVAITGSQANINAALASLLYQPNLNFNGQDRIIVNVNDQGRTGGVAATDTDTLTINVTPVNDVPVLTVPTVAQRINEDTPLTLPGITVSDVDAGTGELQVTLTADQGALTLNPTAGVTISGSATNTLTLTGQLASLQNALRAIVYQGAVNYNGSDTVTITVNDQGNTGLGNALSDSRSISVTVVPVNDTPTLTLPTGPLTIDEDTDLVFSGPSAIALTDVDSGSTPIQITLAVNSGTVTLASTAGIQTTNGGNGTRSITFEGTLENVRAALDGLIYRGNSNFNGPDNLTVTVNDRGATGATSGIPVTRSVSLTVASVNDIPVIVTNAGITVVEGTSRTFSNGLLRTTDADNPPLTSLVYTVTSAPTNGAILLNGVAVSANGTFTQADIDAGNRLRYQHNGSETLVDSFVFQVSDGQATPQAGTVNITVSPSNDSPIVQTNRGLNLSEGETRTIDNTLLRVSDPDSLPTNLRYVLSSAPTSSLRLNGVALSQGQSFTQDDVDNGRITYRHNGSETTTDSFQFSVSDGQSSTPLQSFTIGITSVNDVPVVSVTPFTINEGDQRTIGAAILGVSDPDTAATAIVYTLSSAPVYGSLVRGSQTLGTNDTFTQDQVTSGQIVYRHNGSESVNDVFVFRVSDGQSPAIPGIVNITVNPINDSPVLLSNNALIVSGNTPSITTIGNSQLFTTDSDTLPDQLVYSLTNVPNSTIGSIRRNGVALSPGQTFTQADIDAGNITFQYLGGGSGESFQFNVSDGNTSLSGFFDITFTYS